MMRKQPVKAKGFAPRTIIRVVLLYELIKSWQPDLQFLVQINTQDEIAQFKQLILAGLNNVALLTSSPEVFESWSGPAVLAEHGTLQSGDVTAISENMINTHVLFRESDQHHTVFLTNRCNSNCLMCSQPPTLEDDSWLIHEACQIAQHIRNSPKLLGFSGGEPLLLGESLGQVLTTFINKHPDTKFDLLSNGRLLAEKEFADQLLKTLKNKVTWMIPLYGHADFLHDFIVQSHGAFEETLAGLLNLHACKQEIQLRTVLIQPVLEYLPAFCEFISKNLPFVREVALMACEPIGFALANPDLSDVDLRDWQYELELGVKILERSQINVILMNAPLCALSPELRKYAHKSISDWKRKFEPECKECTVKDDCSGLFTWYSQTKNIMKINKIEGVVNV